MAGHMACGCSRAAGMRAVLAASDDAASHPELSALLKRVVEIKTVPERDHVVNR